MIRGDSYDNRRVKTVVFLFQIAGMENFKLIGSFGKGNYVNAHSRMKL